MPAISGEPFRGLAVVRLTDALGTRAFSLSVDNVDPLTVGADQSTWEGTSGSSLTLRLEWAESGTPVNGVADDATVSVRLPGDGTDIGATWTPTIGSASGSATQTFHFDNNPLNGSADTARVGMLELFFSVRRTTAATWGPLDSRGGGSPPAGDTFDFARGFLRGNVILSSYSISNVSLGGTEPSTFAFPDTTFNRVVLDAVRYRSGAVTLKHRQSADVRSQAGSSGTGVTHDYTWSAAANGVSGNGRINKDYSSAQDVDVYVVLPADTFGGDFEYAWHSSGQPAGFSASGNEIADDDRFDVDPAITLDSVATGASLYNRSKASSHTFKIKNARTEDIGITGVWQLRDSTNAVVTSFTAAPSSGTYTGNYTIGAANRAAYDLTGDQWNIITSFVDMSGSQAGPSNVFKVSRKWQFSTSASSITNTIFTADAPHSPSSDTKTEFIRCQNIWFNLYVYDANGVLLGSVNVFVGMRPVGSETPHTPTNTGLLSAGHWTGEAARMTVPLSATTGDKALVVASESVTSTNQPRSGFGGLGNFAETSLVTPEFEVVGSTVNADGQVIYGGACCDCGDPCFWCCVSPCGWKTTIAGVTNGDCTDCGNFNKTHILNHNLHTLNSGCGPGVFGTGSSTICEWLSDEDITICGTTFSQFVVGIQNRTTSPVHPYMYAYFSRAGVPNKFALYETPAGVPVNCVGPNTLELVTSSDDCANWPNSIIVEPVYA